MDLTVAERVSQVELKYSSLERFFEIEGSRKRKGKDADISEKLKKTVTSLRSIGKTANNSHRFIALIIGAMNFMKVPVDELFVLFEVNCRSYNFFSFIPFLFPYVCVCPTLVLKLFFPLSRKQQALTRSKRTSLMRMGDQWWQCSVSPLHRYAQLVFLSPVSTLFSILIPGSNPIDNPKAFVVVENRIISEKSVPVHSAILAAFMCYFVFKIEYPFTAASILYFLQR